MHNLQSLGSASLDTMGGLITNTAPSDLPEGASPRCWDCDFITGSVFTRPGLSSIYTFATTFQISSVSVYNGIATFNYASTLVDPTVNESFLLYGFTGAAFVLNNQTVVVNFVNPTQNYFTANVTGIANLPLTVVSAFAVSTTGLFVGPRTPTIASQSGTGVPWVSPENILGDTSFATVTTSTFTELNPTVVPVNAGSVPVENDIINPYWNNPLNINSTSAFSTVTLPSSGQQSASIVAYNFPFSPTIPSNATIVGVQVSYKAAVTSGDGVVTVQLSTNSIGFGTAFTQILTGIPTVYTAGGPTNLWGASSSLTPAYFNAGNSSGILIWANNTGATSASFEANSIDLTLYYTVPSDTGTSEILSATSFGYALSNSTGVLGLGVSFQAFSSGGDTTLTIQLQKGGVAVGNPKTVTLTSVPQIYSLGTSTDLWGSTWQNTDINNTEFGVLFTATGTGTTSLNDVDTLIYTSSSLANFNYIKTYEQQDGQIYTLALDANGTIWEENVSALPGFLSIAYSGIIPGSFAQSTTADDREYICFSDLSAGTDRPRIYDGTGFFPLSQVGPGASPQFTSATGTTTSNTITITAITALGSNEYLFTYTGNPVGSSQSYKLSGFTTPYTALNGLQIIAGNPTATTFTAYISSVTVPSGSGLSGTGTLTFNFPIQSITQNPQNIFDGQEIIWCAGVNDFSNPGSTYVFFYLSNSGQPVENPALVSALNGGLWPVYVYITDAPTGFNGTWQVLTHGTAYPPHESGFLVPYFTVQAPTSGQGRWGGPGGSSGPQGPNNAGFWQMTVATVTFPFAIPGLVTGGNVQIEQVSGAGTVTSWNNTWTILQTPYAGTYTITSSYYPPPGTPFSNDGGAPSNANGGLVQYSWSFSGGTTTPPQVGQLVTITGCTNLGFLNVTGYIFAVSGAFFYVDGFSQTQYDTSGPVAEGSSAQAITFGTQVIIDPGPLTVGTDTDPIYGNFDGTGTDANVAIIGTSITPIGSGTRQGMVFFITESGYWTPASPPVTFTTSEQANYIYATKIPTGPSNVVGRGIAFTEAGQNGVPGANFYVIPNQVTGASVNGQPPPIYSSTIIWDNTTTSAQFTFTDAVLLNSEEVDIPGADLFNLIELGSSAWCVQYASRMFYGLQLNKVQNFNNLSFDGGPYSNGTTTVTNPLGWTLLTNSVGGSVIASPVTGNAWYIQNTGTSTLSIAGAICQSAYQDSYNVPILDNNTTYSVRVAASCPSGLGVGTLTFQLCLLNTQSGTLSGNYGIAAIPLSSMQTTVTVFNIPLLTSSFNSSNIGQVPTELVLALYVTNLGAGGDCLIDRVEIYPTQQPVLGAQVYGSYINDLESIDASGSGGIIDTTSLNPQFVMGGFVLHDNLYLLKTDSMCVTEDTPGSEPGGWSVREVSNKVGSIGIHSYDYGEEWAVTACRSGIYGFNGGQPIKLMQELWNLWEMINWDAGNTIVLRNDNVNRRLLCAVPLPTPNQWLPFDPINPSPTSPNVILMCNYQGLNSFDELVNSPQIHTTMFGTLAAVDMKRKWSIWRVKTPYMDFITRQEGESKPLFVCNGIDSSKIYQFLDNQLSDDGVSIWGLYTTYGFVNAAKAATLPIFGFHQKRYTTLQFTAEGAGTMQIVALPNTLSAVYPYTVPGGAALADPMYDDFFRPLNVRGNRCYLEFYTNAVGSWFQLHKILLSGKADSWAPISPTGGGNVGISSVQ